MHLYLTRHGETQWNVQGRIQGWGNSPLTARGREQASQLGQRLADVPLKAVYCSDVDRTRETAEIIIAGRQIEIRRMSQLRETCWGRWEGKTAAEIEAAEPELWARFIARGSQMSEHDDSCEWETQTLVPGGETLEEVNRRISEALEIIRESAQDDDDRVLVVGHGGSLRLFLTLALDLPPRKIRRWHLDNASLSHILYLKGHPPVIQQVNDTGHYGGGI